MITCMITVLESTKMIKNYTVLMVSDILLISRQDWRDGHKDCFFANVCGQEHIMFFLSR